MAELRVTSQGVAAKRPYQVNPLFRPAVIFPYNDAGLLIVPALFFIQRRNGEVAEWSKALPC